MKKLIFYAIGTLLLCNNPVEAHPNSISFSEITIGSDNIKYDLRTILSEFITHAVPADDNGDQKLDEGELQKHQQAIYDYFNSRIKIRGPHSAYTLQMDSITVSESGMPSITFHLNFIPKNQKVGSLIISNKIFEDVENHRSLAKITSGEETGQFVFTLDNQYERKIAGEDFRIYFWNEVGWAGKVLAGLLALIGVFGILWFVRRAFLTGSSLHTK